MLALLECVPQKIPKVLLLYVTAGPHTNVHSTEAITECGWTVLPLPSYGYDLASSDFHLFSFLEGSLQGCRYVDDEALQNAVHK
jgi:hypothetical protein